MHFDALFFVEHKDREYDIVKRIVDCLYDEFQISSAVLSIPFQTDALNHISANCFLFPFLLGKEDWPVKCVYRKFGENVEYINLNYEQLLSNSNKDYKKPRDNFARQYVKHVAWDQSFKDFLTSSGVAPDNVYITGNPAYDLMRGILRQKEDIRQQLANEYSLDFNKKWLFMPMNYGWAFLTERVIRKKISNGYDEKIAWDYHRYSKSCVRQFVDFISDVAQLFDWEIIVRPHPNVSVDEYVELFQANDLKLPQNLLLTKSYSVKEWLAASEVVGSSWSTVVWDACNVGKPVFLYTPESRPDWLDVEWNNHVPNIADPAELRSLCDNSCNTRLDLKGQDAIGEIVNLVRKTLTGIQRTTPVEVPPQLLRSKLEMIRCQCRRLSMKHLGGAFVPKGKRSDSFDAIYSSVKSG